MTDLEEECPVCAKKGLPKCPYYQDCKYRLAQLCPISICWREPEACTAYNETAKKNREKEAIKFSPSSREFR